ncbi:MAG TPA: leucine-rich repeat protein [Flavobacterium sp.]
MLLFFGITAASAQTIFTVNYVDYTITSETTVTYSKLNQMTHNTYTIPSTVVYNSKTYTVTAIGTNAFHINGYFDYVNIPNTITTIGSFAFWSCFELDSIVIPNSVTSIETGAFRDCTNLTSVTLPNSITTIEPLTFSYCDNLTSINIPPSITTIKNQAFIHCKSLTSFTIPNTVTTLGNSIFSYCSSLATVTIPSSITSMGYDQFEYNTSLTLLICDMPTPPAIGPDFFRNVDMSKLSLQVPPSSSDAYKSAYGWSNINTINGVTLATDSFSNQKEAVLYPNPFSNELFLDLNTAEVTELEVLDINGKSLLSKTTNTETNVLDTSYLPSGMYFIKVSSGNTSSVKKMIKK